jgi:predicted TIM-barrel fold metal-dependent hydrolase
METSNLMKTLVTFDVLDCHHHVGDVSAFVPQLANDDGLCADRARAKEMEDRLAIMDRDGVQQAIVIPGHGYARPRGQPDTEAINDAIAAYSAARPDRFPAAVGIVEPLHGAVSFQELERCRSVLGLAGISFHAISQGISMDHPSVIPLVARIGELGLVPVLHAHFEYVSEAIWKVERIAKALPGLPMLILDSLASYESVKQAAEVAEARPQLLFDTSLAATFDHIHDLVLRIGAERVVFGTDLYSPPLGKRISHLAGQIATAELPDADKALILGGNARRLFGIVSS